MTPRPLDFAQDANGVDHLRCRPYEDLSANFSALSYMNNFYESLGARDDGIPNEKSPLYHIPKLGSFRDMRAEESRLHAEIFRGQRGILDFDRCSASPAISATTANHPFEEHFRPYVNASRGLFSE